MKKNLILKNIAIVCSLFSFAHISHAAELKRFSVSAGWLHVMPQGKANPFNINTKVNPASSYQVGSVSSAGFINSLDADATLNDYNIKSNLEQIFAINEDGTSFAQQLGLVDANNNVLPDVTGSAYLNGIDQWRQQGTGLEADDTDTLGLMFNYYINDHVSLQLIGGIPPKVDIKGKGEIIAPMSGTAFPEGFVGEIFTDGLPLKQDIPITNLGNKNKAASVRAWTPALEAQYQFGQSGVTKFRPYVGAGVMYAHFNNIKLNSEIKSDLVAAGHMIQNILDGQAGAALDGKTSSASPYVKVKAEDAFAPIVSLGATYDINQNWFGVASVSYAKLNNKATINVIDKNTGNRLIHATTKIDIDPIITYVGVGYRF